MWGGEAKESNCIIALYPRTKVFQVSESELSKGQATFNDFG
jgi:hypothetical protein